jgi:hypothetical protein
LLFQSAFTRVSSNVTEFLEEHRKVHIAAGFPIDQESPLKDPILYSTDEDILGAVRDQVVKNGMEQDRVDAS